MALNLLFLVPGETGGMETYARRLVPELAGVVGARDLTLLVSDRLAAEMRERPWVDGAPVAELRVPGHSRVRRTLAEQTALPLRVRRARTDVLHNLQSIAPVASGARAMVTTVHDLLYHHHPATHTALLRRGMGLLVPLAVRRSDRVIVPSGATRDDLVDTLGADPERIDVVHHGPGLLAEPTAEDTLRARLDLGDRPVLLSPSARRAHKNLPRLLQAFARGADGHDAVLVLPGYATGAEDALAAEARRLGVADRVRLAGWVSDAELAGLYACSTALVLPSLAEGFGLPVLEAMARGLPVACADRTSLPEIAGEAALLFDPESVDAIAGAIGRLLTDGSLRVRLADAGRERAAAFSWERAARATAASYERALSR